MREILFRGKRKDNGEWVEGSLILTTSVKEKTYIVDSCYCYDECIDEDGYADFDRLNAFEVIPETVRQYTGLTDKNGAKIFEGDIVKGTFLGFTVPIKDYVFSISWQEDVTGYRANYFENVEVISNIHDNPELLKEGDGE